MATNRPEATTSLTASGDITDISGFILRRSSLHYLLLQRTQYQSGVSRLFRGRFLRHLYDRYFVELVESHRQKRIAHLYFAEMREKLEQIQPVLDTVAPRRVLDIGAGLAGIDALLYDEFRNKGALDIYLLDKNEIADRIHYAFKPEGAAYNSFERTIEFLTDNGVPPDRIHAINIATEPFPKDEQFDLVTSYISWGFHYPLSTYLEEVFSGLSNAGALIVDVRRNTSGLDELHQRFSKVEILGEESKYVTAAAFK